MDTTQVWDREMEGQKGLLCKIFVYELLKFVWNDFLLL